MPGSFNSPLWLAVTADITDIQKVFYVISNTLIWSAYIILPILIFLYLRKRGKQLTHNGLYLLFSAFVLITGITFLLDTLFSAQSFSATQLFFRFMTALTSWATVIYLARYLLTSFTSTSPKILQDEITKRILAEKELKAKNERLLEAERTARLGYGSWDIHKKKGTFSEMACQILGIPYSTEIELSQVIQQIHPADVKFVTDCMKKNLNSRKFQEFYFRVISTNMEIKHILFKGEVIRSAAGNPIYVKGTLQDVSELRRHMQKIEQQNKKLKKIAWVQSHRMRSPVATIIGLSDLLNRDNPADPMNADILNHIKSLSVQLDEMIKEVDELTRDKESTQEIKS
jgi:PAS domain-containing protein